METLPRIGVSRSEMMKRVARFKELKGFDGGLPDSRRLSDGIRLWPPARIFAFGLPSNSNASASEAGFA